VIFSVGSVNVDVQVRTADPDARGTTVVATDPLIASGGKAANVAHLVARLGAPACLFASVGSDEWSELALAGPAAVGVDVGGVQRAQGSTGLTSAVVAPDASKTMYRVAAANDEWPEGADLLVQALGAAPSASVLVIDLEVPPQVVHHALHAARRAGVAVVVDPAPPDRMAAEHFHLVDHMTPDVEEASELTGIDASTDDGALAAASCLHELGVAHAHVKLEDGGAALATDSGRWLVRAPENLDVVDTTGVGDAFAAGLAWAAHRGVEPVEAARWAVAAAAHAVTVYGSQAAAPTRHQLDEVHRRVAPATPA
jgi:ribokinase